MRWFWAPRRTAAIISSAAESTIPLCSKISPGVQVRFWKKLSIGPRNFVFGFPCSPCSRMWMNRSNNFHLIVIGAGSGGLVCAAGGAALGAKVALIEKKRRGGDCLITGCVPSKSILRAARLPHDAKTADRFGIAPMNPAVDLDRVMASVRKVQEKIAPHDSVERFTSLGVSVRFGSYRFLSPHEITDGNEVLSA